jgi:hypothetical protein
MEDLYIFHHHTLTPPGPMILADLGGKMTVTLSAFCQRKQEISKLLTH